MKAIEELGSELPLLRRSAEASREASRMKSVSELCQFAASPKFATTPSSETASLHRRVVRYKIRFPAS